MTIHLSCSSAEVPWKFNFNFLQWANLIGPSLPKTKKPGRLHNKVGSILKYGVSRCLASSIFIFCNELIWLAHHSQKQKKPGRLHNKVGSILKHGVSRCLASSILIFLQWANLIGPSLPKKKKPRRLHNIVGSILKYGVSRCLASSIFILFFAMS